MQYLELHENKKHGTTEFPFEYHHLDKKHPRYTMDYHWHEEFELIRVLKGTLEMTVNELHIPLRSGELVLVPGGALHAGVPENCTYECLVFDLGYFMNSGPVSSPWFHKILSKSIRPCIFYDGSSKEVIRAASAVFSSVAEPSPGYELSVAGSVSLLFGLILTHELYETGAPESVRGMRKVSKIKDVIDFIEHNYSSDITLDELSKVASMNPKYFCRFFREMTSRTPMDYLNYQRIEHAAHDLSHAGKSVTEAAYGCGFNDLSYFIRTFRKYKGVTPGKYRE